MGKSKRQKSEILRRTAKMRSAYRKWLLIFIILLVVCLCALAAYMYLTSSMILVDTGMMPWITAVVAAGALGVLSNKFSKARREYEGYLYKYNLTDEDIKDYIKAQKNGE